MNLHVAEEMDGQCAFPILYTRDRQCTFRFRIEVPHYYNVSYQKYDSNKLHICLHQTLEVAHDEWLTQDGAYSYFNSCDMHPPVMVIWNDMQRKAKPDQISVFIITRRYETENSTQINLDDWSNDAKSWSDMKEELQYTIKNMIDWELTHQSNHSHKDNRLVDEELRQSTRKS